MQHDSYVDIHVRVHDEQAERDLRRLDDALEREMAKIEKSKAEFKVGADLDNLKRDLKEAEAEVKEYNRRIDKAESKHSQAALRRYRDQKVAAVDAKRAEVQAGQEALKAQQKTNKEYDLTAKRIALINKHEAAREKIEMRRLQLRQRGEALAAREETRRERELAQVPKLEAAYNRLISKLDKLDQAKRKARGDGRAVFTLDLEENDVKKRMETIRSEVNRIAGRDPVTMEITPRLSERAGERLRMEFFRHGGSLMPIAAAVGLDVGTHMGNRASLGFRRTMDRGVTATMADFSKRIAGSGARGAIGMLGRLGHAVGGLSSASVRLGPFTTSLRGAFIGLSLLGPILVDVVGALGSLVGVAGSAALGVGALGAAFIGGAIPAMAGFAFVIKDVIQEFAAAKKATKAYDDAVMKHGKGSDQAKTKMKELRNVMSGVSAETARQFASAQGLGEAWDKATKPARASVWKTIGQAIKTGGVLMDDFAQRTNTGMGVAEKATTRWMKAIRSPEGRMALNTMMDNFNTMLGPVLNGLGDVAGYFAKVGQVASHALPGLGRTFENWAQGLNDSADGSAKFQDKIREIIQSAKDVGNFFMAAGRLMKSFFGGGVEAGQSFTNTMTNAMNRWTAFLNTAQGQESLGDFFREAVAGAQSLWGFIAPLAAGFTSWAQSISPIARGFFEGASAVSQFIAAVGRLLNQGGALTGLATTLGALWAFGKISSAARAVTGFTTALLGLSRAQTAVAATSVAANVAGSRSMVIPAGGMARSTATVTKAGAEAAKAATGFARFRGAAGGAVMALTGMSLPVAAAVVGVGALSYGLYKLATRTQEYEKQAAESAKFSQQWRKGVQMLPAAHFAHANAMLQAEGAALQLKDAEKQVQALQKDGKKGTDEYRYATLNLRQAQQQDYAARVQMKTAIADENKLLDQNVKASEKRAAAANKAVRAAADEPDTISGIERINKLMDEGLSLQEATNKAASEYDTGAMVDGVKEAGRLLLAQRNAQAEVRRQQDLNTLAVLNQQRATRGLVPIAQQAATAFGALSRSMPKLSQKISLKFDDPGQAAKVAAQASRALKAGVPQRMVFRIIADSKSAEEALRRLARVRLDTKRLRILEQGGAEAYAMVRKLVGARLVPKVMKILGEAGDAESKVRKLIALGIPPKIARMLGNNSDALAKAREANSTSLRDLFQKIIRQIQDPPNLGFVGSIVQTVRRVFTGGAKASGKRAGEGAETAWVGEGSRWQGAREYAVDRKTGMVSRYDQPTVAALSRDTAVIPTEPRHRARGRSIFGDIARDLGLERYAAGRFTGAGDTKARKKNPAVEFHPEKRLGPPSYLKKKKKPKSLKGRFKARRGWAGYIENLDEQQGYWEREVSIRESQVNEPADWVIETGKKKVTDPTTGEVTEIPTYGPNTGPINQYKTQLSKVSEAMGTLLQIVAELVRAIPLAMRANKDESGTRKDRVTDLNKEIEKEKRKKPSTDKGKQAKADRIEKLRRTRDEHQEVYDQLVDDHKLLSERRVDAGFDYREVSIAKGNVDQDMNDATGRGDREAASQNESASGSGSGGGSGGGSGSGSGGGGIGSTAGERAVSEADTLRALTEAGLPGGAASLTDAIAAQLSAQTTRLAEGQAMLTDSIAGNDMEGNSIVQAAASAIKSLNDELRNLPTSAGQMAQQYMALGTARQGLYSQFGSNFAIASQFGASQGVAGRLGRTTPSFAFGPSGAMQGFAGGGAGGANVVINNSFPTPPADPHTWSQGVAFELQAAL